jgi:hypothetical protein
MVTETEESVCVGWKNDEQKFLVEQTALLVICSLLLTVSHQ